MKNIFGPLRCCTFCLVIITFSATEITLAASSRVRTPTPSPKTTEQPTAKQRNNPIYSPYAHTIIAINWYKYLGENENFMKWQDMARYFWEQQTGEQRLMSTSQKRFYKRRPHPLRFNRAPSNP